MFQFAHFQQYYKYYLPPRVKLQYMCTALDHPY